VQKIERITDDTLRTLVDEPCILAHRDRALTPDRPVVRGTAQNPDVFFQSREIVNRFYADTPAIVQNVMNRFAAQTGRAHTLFEYYGVPDADRVIVIMGSGASTVRSTIAALPRDEKIGVVVVKLYRPFAVDAFLDALPKSVTRIAVLDRTKEPGAIGEPLFQDVVTALAERSAESLALRGEDVARAFKASVIGGRYGLGSKEFSPAMVKAVFDELAKPHPKPRFTVGIVDDVTGLSLKVDETFTVEPAKSVRAVFYGLGADGTVGANKNSI